MVGDASARQDLFSGLDSQILSRRPENIFLVKATYRFIL